MKTHVWDKEKSQVRLFFIKIRPVFVVWTMELGYRQQCTFCGPTFLLNRGTLGTDAHCSLVTIETNHQKPSAILINANDTEGSNHK